MHKTRLSLFYLAGYTLPSGLMLMFLPQVALQLLFSNRIAEYGDIFPRLAGGVILALGMIVVQTIRLRLEVLYPTYIAVRVVLVTVLLGLYFYSRDPLFISLFVIVGFGLLLTSVGYLMDRRETTLGTGSMHHSISN